MFYTPLPLEFDGLAPVLTEDDYAYDPTQDEMDELKADLLEFDTTAR